MLVFQTMIVTCTCVFVQLCRTTIAVPVPIDINRIIDPLEQYEDIPAVKRNSKSVFNVPYLTNTPVEDCPLGTKRISQGGGCVSNAPNVFVDEAYLRRVLGQRYSTSTTEPTTKRYKYRGNRRTTTTTEAPRPQEPISDNSQHLPPAYDHAQSEPGKGPEVVPVPTQRPNYDSIIFDAIISTTELPILTTNYPLYSSTSMQIHAENYTTESTTSTTESLPLEMTLRSAVFPEAETITPAVFDITITKVSHSTAMNTTDAEKETPETLATETIKVEKSIESDEKHFEINQMTTMSTTETFLHPSPTTETSSKSPDFHETEAPVRISNSESETNEFLEGWNLQFENTTPFQALIFETTLSTESSQ